MSVRQYVGARYVPRFSPINGGVWDNTYSYEALEIVKYGNDYYTSKIPVPPGIDITNTTYWVKTGDYNGAIGGLDTRLTSAENAINEQADAIDELKDDIAYRLYLSDYETFTDAVTAINALDNSCLVIDKNVTITEPVTISKPCHLVGDTSNNTLTLNANIHVLTDDFKSSNVIYNINGGSIVIGARTFGRAVVRYNFINNTFFTLVANIQQIALNFIRGTTGNISGNFFYCDLDNNNFIAIYHDQNNENDWFQNTSITNNSFRRIYSDLYIAGRTNPEKCAGIEFCNNNSIWTVNAIHIESSDHFVISDNIIDFAGAPVYLRSPNGLRLINNYLYSENNNTIVDILCNTFTEHVIISGNYIWNRIVHSSSNITYGIKITTDNNYTIEDVVIDNNQFRNEYYDVYVACNVNGLMIHSNAFKSSNTGIYLSSSFTFNRSHYYGNFTANDTSAIINGAENGYVVNTTYLSRSIPAGATEERFAIPNNVKLTRIVGIVVRFPYTGISASSSVVDLSSQGQGQGGILHFSSPLPQDTNLVIQITQMVDHE